MGDSEFGRRNVQLAYVLIVAQFATPDNPHLSAGQVLAECELSQVADSVIALGDLPSSFPQHS